MSRANATATLPPEMLAALSEMIAARMPAAATPATPAAKRTKQGATVHAAKEIAFCGPYFKEGAKESKSVAFLVGKRTEWISNDLFAWLKAHGLNV